MGNGNLWKNYKRWKRNLNHLQHGFLKGGQQSNQSFFPHLNFTKYIFFIGNLMLFHILWNILFVCFPFSSINQNHIKKTIKVGFDSKRQTIRWGGRRWRSFLPIHVNVRSFFVDDKLVFIDLEKVFLIEILVILILIISSFLYDVHIEELQCSTESIFFRQDTIPFKD